MLGLAGTERLAWWLVITAQDYYKGTTVMSDPLPGFRLGLGKTVESRYYFVCYLYFTNKYDIACEKLISGRQ